MTVRENDGARLQRTPPENDCQSAHSSATAVQQEQKSNRKTLRPQSKRAALLREFLKRGDAGLNCFQAARECHDYVLRSTVSDYRRSFGIEFHRRYETVPGHAGSKIDCCRYWLSPEGAAKARALLEDA